MQPTPQEMSSHELEVMFQAALGRGEKAGRIKMVSLSRLEIGNLVLSFGHDSARYDWYWDATRNLIGYGYLHSLNDGIYYECTVSTEGYEVAEACCYEWWKREFDAVRRRITG